VQERLKVEAGPFSLALGRTILAALLSSGAVKGPDQARLTLRAASIYKQN